MQDRSGFDKRNSIMRTCIAKLSLTAAAFVMGAHGASAQQAQSGPCDAGASGSCAAEPLTQPIDVARPAPLRTSAYITQVGNQNQASIRQSASQQFARIAQNGDGNSATARQMGEGVAYLEVDQAGLLNSIVVKQDATPGGSNVALAEQFGEDNVILLDQTATAGSPNGAVLVQNGTGNQMNLQQAGSDNRAELIQLGDNNAMTATQNGSDNQLRWVQDGNGLSDLQIVQSGSQAISITQSNGGN
jgi:minor curlin subunit